MKNGTNLLEFVAFGENISNGLKETLKNIYYGEGGQVATIKKLENLGYEVETNYIESTKYSERETKAGYAFDIYREKTRCIKNWQIDNNGKILESNTSREPVPSCEMRFE